MSKSFINILQEQCNLPKDARLDINLISKAHTICFLFGLENRWMYFAKIARGVKENYRIQNEYKNLKIIQDLCPKGVIQHIPKVKNFGSFYDNKYLITEYISGREFLNYEKNINLTSRIIEWIINFSDMTSSRFKIDKKYLSLIINKVKDLAPEIIELKNVLKLLNNKYLLSLRYVMSHGDFSYRNILFNGNNFYIVDWELAEEKGIPLFDLFDFSLYVFYLKRQNYHEAAKELFSLQNPVSLKIKEVIIDYTIKNNILSDCINSLFVLFCLKKIFQLTKSSTKKSIEKIGQLKKCLESTEFNFQY